MKASNLFFVFGLVMIGSLGASCGKAKGPDGGSSTHGNKPTVDSTPSFRVTAAEMTVDRSKLWPVFKVSKSASVQSKLQIHIVMDELRNPNVLTREVMVIPLDNSAAAEEWAVEGPVTLAADAMGEVTLVKAHLDQAIVHCKVANKTVYGREDTQFKLQVIYSSAPPNKVTQFIVEIPLE